MKCFFSILAFTLVIGCRHAAGQSPNSLNSEGQPSDSVLMWSDPAFAELDSILNSTDSLSIIDLIDSLLMLTEDYSQLAVRLGYNSNITSAVNTVEIKKFGLSPGIAYYHKSGFFVDLGTYWSREFDPAMYLTVASVGYLGIPTAKWSILGEYAHYFYNAPDSIEGTGTKTNTPYTDNLYLSNFVDIGLVTFRLDYSFLFGRETANRFYPAVGLDLVKKKWLGFERIRFFPSAGLLFGNETVESLVPNPAGGRPQYVPDINKPWGILNYNLTAPVSANLEYWTFLASYSYNFPQSLPGELLDVSHGGYITLSITRYFRL